VPPPGYLCNRCNQPGHYITECKQTSVPPASYVCNRCHKGGHYIVDCTAERAPPMHVSASVAYAVCCSAQCMFARSTCCVRCDEECRCSIVSVVYTKRFSRHYSDEQLFARYQTNSSTSLLLHSNTCHTLLMCTPLTLNTTVCTLLSSSTAAAAEAVEGAHKQHQVALVILLHLHTALAAVVVVMVIMVVPVVLTVVCRHRYHRRPLRLQCLA
jgi:Zinc knuckle